MAYIKGRNVRVEIAATYGAAKSITAITNADPGVATSAAHGLTAGAVGYLTGVTGMAQLEGQAVRVSGPVTNAFNLETIDTTTMGTFSGTASFVPVATWLTLVPSTSYAIGGGEADRIDDTVLLDVIKQESAGILNAQNVSFDLRSEDVLSAAVRLVRKQALSQAFLLYHITFGNGSQRIFRGEPSLPNENLQQGQSGTGSLSTTVKGQVLFLD